MGMHFGIVAAKATLDQFKSACREIWPELEVGRSRSGFASFDEIDAWSRENHRFVSSKNWSLENPGSEVCWFYQDGPWAVLVDNSYVQAADRDALERLSSKFLRAISIIIETSGGTAHFTCCEQGKLRRSLAYYNGELHREGVAVPEEAGFVVDPDIGDTFYMDEVDRLMTALGLTRVGDESLAAKIEAVELIDRKDYSRILGRTDSAAASGDAQLRDPPSPKAWWKFW